MHTFIAIAVRGSDITFELEEDPEFRYILLVRYATALRRRGITAGFGRGSSHVYRVLVTIKGKEEDLEWAHFVWIACNSTLI